MAPATSDPTRSGYTPDPDLKIHDHAIRLLCQPFQSHENGLPEWPKNAADEYARRNEPEGRRVIVVMFQDARGDRPSSIACLDFCGFPSSVIDDRFRYWADPEAATRGESRAVAIQGGHGNGGKCYMAQMFDSRAYLHTVHSGLGSRYGTVERAVRFGYFPDRDSGKDFPVADVAAELDGALSAIGISTSSLPKPAVDALAVSGGFTLVAGVDPVGYDGPIPWKHLVEALEDHPQMRLTIELCDVFVIANGRPVNDGEPLQLADIPTMPGAEEPRVVQIPDSLTDPASGQSISTTADGSLASGELTLRTSDVSMRRTRKARHVISYRAQSGYVGYRGVREFDVQSTYRDRIYGECVLIALEPFKQNMRADLADSPLTRALEDWISSQIEEYSRVFEETRPSPALRRREARRCRNERGAQSVEERAPIDNASERRRRRPGAWTCPTFAAVGRAGAYRASLDLHTGWNRCSLKAPTALLRQER